MSKFKLPVSWEMCGEVEVEAESLEAALEEFQPQAHDVPDNGSYVHGSFQLTSNDIEDVKAMTGQNHGL
jgi:hypothetical protein